MKKNNRVIKFKDPFAYVSLKDDNPYAALYEHHIHNNFFGEVGYRFLGVSQDPVSGGVRFAFEQPYITSESKPTKGEITQWFKQRGFELTPDGFWYTDGNVSFTDVEGDNCIKDDKDHLHFIDPIIKFEKEPKEVIAHYIEKSQDLKDKLSRAGIDIGTRFRVQRLCSLNDIQVKDIDYGGGMITFFHPTKHPDYQYEIEWPIKKVLEFIKLNQCYCWVMTDEERNDIVIPEAREAIMERVKDKSPHAAFTDEQIKALERYETLHPDSIDRESIYTSLVNQMTNSFREQHIPDAWVDDMLEELKDLTHGERRNISTSLTL